MVTGCFGRPPTELAVADSLGIHATPTAPIKGLDLDVRIVGTMLFSVADPGSQFVINFVPVTIQGEPASSTPPYLWKSDRRFIVFLRSGATRPEDSAASR